MTFEVELVCLVWVYMSSSAVELVCLVWVSHAALPPTACLAHVARFTLHASCPRCRTHPRVLAHTCLNSHARIVWTCWGVAWCWGVRRGVGVLDVKHIVVEGDKRRAWIERVHTYFTLSTPIRFQLARAAYHVRPPRDVIAVRSVRLQVGRLGSFGP